MLSRILPVILVLFLFACSGQKEIPRAVIQTAGEEAADTAGYELIILDPGFESWFITQAKPAWFHSQTYLENWNRQYVSAWNARVMTHPSSRIFETYIDYQPHIDYGLELNHRLFYYFQYVEKKLRIPILPDGLSPKG